MDNSRMSAFIRRRDGDLPDIVVVALACELLIRGVSRPAPERFSGFGMSRRWDGRDPGKSRDTGKLRLDRDLDTNPGGTVLNTT